MKWIDRRIKEPSKDDSQAMLAWSENKHYECVCIVYYGFIGTRSGWTESWTGEEIDFRYWQPLPESPYEEDQLC